jgi:hypothetical protein
VEDEAERPAILGVVQPTENLRMTQSDIWSAHVHAAVDDLTTYLGSTFPILTSQPSGDLVARQLAAGGLVRCWSLVRAMRILEGDRPDVNGLLLRNLWEVSTVGAYVLLGGQAALEEVAGDHARNIRNLVERNDLKTAKDAIDAWSIEPSRVSVEQIATKLGPLLQAAGEHGADATVAYDLLYRSESTFGGHGLGAMTPYVDWTATPWPVVPDRGPITVTHPPAHAGIGALWTVLLAQHVFATFDIGTAILDDLTARVVDVMKEPRK